MDKSLGKLTGVRGEKVLVDPEKIIAICQVTSNAQPVKYESVIFLEYGFRLAVMETPDKIAELLGINS